MAISTTLQPKYSIRMIIIAILCLVFGVWGIYDYVVLIPGKQQLFERGEVYRAVEGVLKQASTELQDGRSLSGETRSDLQEAGQLVAARLQQLPPPPAGDEAAQPEPGTPEEIRARDANQWRTELVLFGLALTEAAGRAPGAPPSDAFVQVYELSRQRVNETGDAEKPGRFDRATQWMFILCLPCFPYFLWVLIKTRRKVYTLDDDGTFHAPEGAWSTAEIADIDMSRWMAKSIAHVVIENGPRIKLDDYVHKNTHLIAGALASERYPDEWDEDAKPITHDEGAEDEEDTPEA